MTARARHMGSSRTGYCCGRVSRMLALTNGPPSSTPQQAAQFKTCRQTAQGKKLCKPWNDARGCTNPKCPDRDGCDVQLPNGNPCNDTKHNRSGHTGPKMPL